MFRVLETGLELTGEWGRARTGIPQRLRACRARQNAIYGIGSAPHPAIAASTHGGGGCPECITTWYSAVDDRTVLTTVLLSTLVSASLGPEALAACTHTAFNTARLTVTQHDSRTRTGDTSRETPNKPLVSATVVTVNFRRSGRPITLRRSTHSWRGYTSKTRHVSRLRAAFLKDVARGCRPSRALPGSSSLDPKSGSEGRGQIRK